MSNDKNAPFLTSKANPNQTSITFQSSAEVKTFIKTNIRPKSNETNQNSAQINAFQNPIKYLRSRILNPNYVGPNGLQPIDQHKTLTAFVVVLADVFVNPLRYDGKVYKAVKEAWITNEVGFLITASFFGTLFWTFVTYRRNRLLATKKRFVFQQYKRSKFLEDSLRLKSREQIIHEKIGKTFL